MCIQKQGRNSGISDHYMGNQSGDGGNSRENTGAHEELFFNDDLPVDEQRQFDNNVLVELDELKKPSLHLLLFYITNVGDTRLTHLTLRRAKALISDKPFLEEILQRSLEIRSFQQVQRLSS
ncbi:uncharacterized protein EI90DRAFT_3076342 [Cantharellus anzutake]|uniref:uncharacterized protein n=1 Tax=Cantharellus anzutake TaxID=1750568 RepID=UPI001903F561|nr:uncharacterized protein EI90DRAFT_3076342 [Cantharellus anzutake]KAF8324212.1 hypothetical protein EI90DRAFT_3076342 [Cantharellus anzutake]